MAVSKLLLGALGLAAAVVATRRKSKVSPRTVVSPAANLKGVGANHPICKKYPGGFWHRTAGYLEGHPVAAPGWSDADLVMAQAAVDAAVAQAPTWDTVADAREVSFMLTRNIIRSWCPSLPLPKNRYQLDNYLEKSIALTWLWQSLANQIWNNLVGVPGGGN